MSKQVTFDFGEHGVCKPDADGLYQGFYDSGGKGISEAEAIRQWLCSFMDVRDLYWPYIERLAELAKERSDEMQCEFCNETEELGTIEMFNGNRFVACSAHRNHLASPMPRELDAAKLAEHLVKELFDQVDKRAQELMLVDGKVSGKHYAAMRLIYKEKFSNEWPYRPDDGGKR